MKKQFTDADIAALVKLHIDLPNLSEKVPEKMEPPFYIAKEKDFENMSTNELLDSITKTISNIRDSLSQIIEQIQKDED